ncbi:MAG TPA: metallophosphoesterase [Bradyrhizobium sp.]
MPSVINRNPLRFVHIGDLHLTEAGLQNHLDLRRIVDDVNRNMRGRIDFVFLPGDNADDGTAEQFRVVHDELSRLDVPWHVIPGDHDFKPRSLDNFYGALGARKSPYATEIGRCRCIFLDVVSGGSGGPDFRLGSSGTSWLRKQLDQAHRDRTTAVVFMHAYPADLGDEAEELAALLDEGPVALVDMGHTHYNELANDGRTIYAATRSTGQIEEGEAGFSFIAVDDGVVSWRFKTLGSPWPFVMITSPADRRLATTANQIEGATCAIRASAVGEVPITEAVFKVDNEKWQPLDGGDGGLFAALTPIPDRPFKLSVRVTDQNSHQDIDTIEVSRRPAINRKSTGSDAGSIGAWPERHLLGTQLGPNRNGRKW